MERRDDSGQIAQVVEKVIEMLTPQKIILYNRKSAVGGEISGFKICIIAGISDRVKTERDIYLNIDCDVPFDVLLYTPEEWERLRRQAGSFAARIAQNGKVLYG